jgi:hypothetical protein
MNNNEKNIKELNEIINNVISINDLNGRKVTFDETLWKDKRDLESKGKKQLSKTSEDAVNREQMMKEIRNEPFDFSKLNKIVEEYFKEKIFNKIIN